MLTTLGLGVTWLLLRAGRSTAPLEPWHLAGLAALVVAATVAVGAALGRWRSWEGVVLAGASVLLGATALGALHGTAWGFDGLYSDAGFRTQAVTRFTDSAALADYAYRDLPAYYPVLWPWLQGRAADLLGVPGWTVMKPAQVLACAVLPVLAWTLWRRVLPPGTAAWVAAVGAVATALPHKPDEWFVLCLLLPWWLEVCRGLRRPEVAPWGAWRHGAVLGLLPLTHTYFFLPMGLATVAAYLLDLARRRPPLPAWRPALRIGAVGLLVSAPMWWTLLAARLSGAPSDDLQRRWSPPGFDGPALPLPTDARGVMELVGVVWLVWLTRRSRLAAALALVLVVSYVVMVGGQLAQPLGLAVLPEKSEELTELVLAVSGVLGIAAVVRRCAARARWAAYVVVVAAAALGLAVSAQSLHRGVVEPAEVAQTMRYPDGSFPAGGTTPANPHWHPWGVAPGDAGPSVEQVETAWRSMTGETLGADDVLVSARADVSATVPVHLFVAWKSIYSHPRGQFATRFAVLERLAACTTPACAHEVLRTNDFDPVDGLLLNRSGGRYYLTLTVDDFPDGWVPRRLTFAPALFSSDDFDTVVLPRAVLVRVAE